MSPIESNDRVSKWDQKQFTETFVNRFGKEKTLDLWDAISKRYKENPIVAAYDILNEPGEKAGSTTTRHFVFMDRVYDVIRANNDQHTQIKHYKSLGGSEKKISLEQLLLMKMKLLF